MCNDLADIDEIHLTAVAAMWGIDDHLTAVGAEPRCGIAAPEPSVFRRGVEVSERKQLFSLRVVEIRMLLSFIVWRGVADDPSITWQVTGVTVTRDHVRRNDFCLARVCIKQVEPAAV